jgi:endoglucanase
MLWDTGGKASDRYYGMYDRTLCKIFNEDIATIYKERSYAAQSKFTAEQIATTAQNNIDDRSDNAPELLSDNPYVGKTDKAVSWIMYNSQDWGVTYSVGDQYNPDSKTDGIKPTDVEITGEGTYTVGLDFTGIDGGAARSFAFSALAISNGETLFPGYVIDIKEIKVNGKPYSLTAKPYTSSDDKHCTRTNIYNEWVKKLPDDARTMDDDLTEAKATIVSQKDEDLQAMKTLTITFYWGPKK